MQQFFDCCPSRCCYYLCNTSTASGFWDSYNIYIHLHLTHINMTHVFSDATCVLQILLAWLSIWCCWHIFSHSSSVLLSSSFCVSSTISGGSRFPQVCLAAAFCRDGSQEHRCSEWVTGWASVIVHSLSEFQTLTSESVDAPLNASSWCAQWRCSWSNSTAETRASSREGRWSLLSIILFFGTQGQTVVKYILSSTSGGYSFWQVSQARCDAGWWVRQSI